MFEKVKKGEKSMTGPGQPRTCSHPINARNKVYNLIMSTQSSNNVCVMQACVHAWV